MKIKKAVLTRATKSPVGEGPCRQLSFGATKFCTDAGAQQSHPFSHSSVSVTSRVVRGFFFHEVEEVLVVSLSYSLRSPVHDTKAWHNGNSDVRCAAGKKQAHRCVLGLERYLQHKLEAVAKASAADVGVDFTR